MPAPSVRSGTLLNATQRRALVLAVVSSLAVMHFWNCRWGWGHGKPMLHLCEDVPVSTENNPLREFARILRLEREGPQVHLNPDGSLPGGELRPALEAYQKRVDAESEKQVLEAFGWLLQHDARIRSTAEEAASKLGVPVDAPEHRRAILQCYIESNLAVPEFTLRMRREPRLQYECDRVDQYFGIVRHNRGVWGLWSTTGDDNAGWFWGVLMPLAAAAGLLIVALGWRGRSPAAAGAAGQEDQPTPRAPASS